MSSEYDREKVVECMFDPVTSLILAELEDGGKKCSYLAERASTSGQDVLERLSYLMEYEFIHTDGNDGDVTVTANLEKLSRIVEDNDAAIDGLAKMDSYLN